MGGPILYDDDSFLIRFKEGNQPAFEKVFNTDYNRIVGFCQQFIGEKESARGLAQEAFVKLWLNRSKIESVNGIRSFLYTSAKTDCLNYIRHRKVINRYEDQQLQVRENMINREILESFDFNPLEFSELESLIEQVISELPEKCRRVFLMSRMEYKKNSEIAAELGVSVKSVEANVTRALKTLRNRLSEYLPLILVHLIIGRM